MALAGWKPLLAAGKLRRLAFMKRKSLRELARDPRFIPGVYNYCDRWCERCPLSQRCLNYAMEQEREDGDPAARDLGNEKFWKELQETLHESMALIQEEAKARGVDLDAPDLRAEAVAQERAQRRRAARHQPLARAAMAYGKSVDQWMESRNPGLAGKFGEWRTQLELEIGQPRAEVEMLADCMDVIRWYQHFIYIKLCRAIDSKAGEDLENEESIAGLAKDSDGTAKIALIALDRSISAWASIRDVLGEEADDILDLLAQLVGLRRETERLFPEARAFVRPGFDTPDKPATAAKPAKAAARKSRR